MPDNGPGRHFSLGFCESTGVRRVSNKKAIHYFVTASGNNKRRYRTNRCFYYISFNSEDSTIVVAVH